ncbi:hypothetical protein M0R72_17400 [Candidatus Pacearchaeota archaeon]|jgi:hypothetical protein|nr:hypothetical protein [Candidatus Pacearchaeota archaeon]
MATKYIRPNFRAITVGTVPVCISLNQAHIPVKEILVQASILNAATVFIGGPANTVNGLEIDPGIAYQWGLDSDNSLAGSLFPGTFTYAESLQRAQREASGQGNSKSFDEVFYDLADFWVISTVPAQIVKVYWSTRVL